MSFVTALRPETGLASSAATGKCSDFPFSHCSQSNILAVVRWVTLSDVARSLSRKTRMLLLRLVAVDLVQSTPSKAVQDGMMALLLEVLLTTTGRSPALLSLLAVEAGSSSFSSSQLVFDLAGQQLLS